MNCLRTSENREVIGAVGGLGPSAGVDLARQIYEQSLASCDADQPTGLVQSVRGTLGTFWAETYLGSQKQPAKKPKKMIGVFSIPLENSHSFQFYHLFSHSLPHYFLRDLRMYLRFCEMRILKIEAKKFETFVRE